MRSLSKSKLLAYRQCEKRLWLEIHHPELAQTTSDTQIAYSVGNTLGQLARQIYDPNGKGTTLNLELQGKEDVLFRTTELLLGEGPIFEAGFSFNDTLVLADILVSTATGSATTWRLVEVKSSTSVKDYYHDDIAIQSYVIRNSDIEITSVALAHIDSSWVYQGDGDYGSLLSEVDMTVAAFGLHDEVEEWVGKAKAISQSNTEPEITTGKHCSKPFQCQFSSYCIGQQPQAKYPVTWLPRVQKKELRKLIESDGVVEMGQVPDELLNLQQLKVKKHTLSQMLFFDAVGAAAALAPYVYPAYFLDFETINFAIPVWKGTRPYQQIPFQFSVHVLEESGTLVHGEFLDLSGADPAESFATAVVDKCGKSGPIYVYNATFEAARLKELAERVPRLREPLLSIVHRLVDLLPIAQQYYYHPSQKGSWSIKAVLPAITSVDGYSKLEGVQDGGMAMAAYVEALQPTTLAERREVIRHQLLEYCKLDTYGMVQIWQYFAGHPHLKL